MTTQQPELHQPPSDGSWLKQLSGMRYACGEPIVTGEMKVMPEDFVVNEIMDVVPSDEGEHVWLNVEKVRANTEAVAKSLARYAGVVYRDVGYSGMKDFFAETRQWFSVWLPKEGTVDWTGFDMAGVRILQVRRHRRKIKRGTHRANAFRIVVRGLNGELSSLKHRIDAINRYGVPNYFGAQRFGNGAQNMQRAWSMLVGGQRIKDRNLRGILLSSARAWMFNRVVSARVQSQTWDSLYNGEPTNLNGTNSVFTAQGTDTETQRLVALDIHPTAPMWGEGCERSMQACTKLCAWEAEILTGYRELQAGLESAGLEYQRRPVRAVVSNLEASIVDRQLRLAFELPRGQYATSVCRELVKTA